MKHALIVNTMNEIPLHFNIQHFDPTKATMSHHPLLPHQHELTPLIPHLQDKKRGLNNHEERHKQERNKTQTRKQIIEQGQNTNQDKLQRKIIG